MKIIGNLGGFCFIARSIASLGKYKRKIDGLRAAGKEAEERAAIADVCDFWSSKVVDYLKLNIDVINPENLPKEGPVVYVANHQSYGDILVFLNVIKHQVGFIAKEELTKIPIFADWTARIGSLFMKRGDARASLGTINQGVDMVKRGYSLVIFPEGTRSRSSQMGEFKPGSLKLATKAKAVVVPVTIHGTYKIYEETGVITKGVSVAFVVHEAIDTAALSRQEQAELADRVEEIIRKG